MNELSENDPTFSWFFSTKNPSESIERSTRQQSLRKRSIMQGHPHLIHSKKSKISIENHPRGIFKEGGDKTGRARARGGILPQFDKMSQFCHDCGPNPNTSITKTPPNNALLFRKISN